MPKFYFVSHPLDIRDPKTGAFYDLDQEDYLECVEKDITQAEPLDTIRVFKTEEDAIKLAQEGTDPEDVWQYPVFTLEYDGKKKATTYTIKKGEHKGSRLPALYVDANQVKLISATLAFISDEFKPLNFNQEQKVENTTAVTTVIKPTSLPVKPMQQSALSLGKRVAQGLGTIAKPGLAGAAGVAFWYFGGPDLLTPYLMQAPLDAMANYLGNYASTALQIIPSAAVSATSYGFMSSAQGLLNWATKKPSTPTNSATSTKEKETQHTSKDDKALLAQLDNHLEHKESDESDEEIDFTPDAKLCPHLAQQKTASTKDSTAVTSTPANDAEHKEKKKMVNK